MAARFTITLCFLLSGKFETAIFDSGLKRFEKCDNLFNFDFLPYALLPNFLVGSSYPPFQA